MEPTAVDRSPYAINLEVVGEDGRELQQRPINVEDLLQSYNRTMDVGNGVTLHLEDYDPNALYPDEIGDGETHEFDNHDEQDGAGPNTATVEGGWSVSVSGQNGSGAAPSAARTGSAPPHAPPGTEPGNWYDVLNALRREREDVEQAAARLAEEDPDFNAGDQPAASRGGRARSARGSTATPLQRFPGSSAHSRTSKSMPPLAMPGASDKTAAATAGRSRRDIWSSFAPASDSKRNYRHLQYVSVLAEQDLRHFRPSALTFHSMASYLHSKDGCQRVLVYGGLSHFSKGVEKELYEFSLLTGGWRRLEGHQFVPAGHYGHAMVVVEAVDRLVVVGGVGPGGLRAAAPHGPRTDEDPLCAKREQLLFPFLQSQTRLNGRASSEAAPAVGPASALTATSKLNTTIGFVPFLFDMDLTTQRWRAVEPAALFPLAFHTAIAVAREIFVFGGLTEAFGVSGQLLAINVDTYSVRLVSGSATARASDDNNDDAESPQTTPPARYLHSMVRYGNYLVVFGGLDSRNTPLQDLWAFDVVNEQWERLLCRGVLHPRWGHAACVVGSRLLITGGFECDLDDSPRQQPVEAGGEAGPTASVMEINLIPTNSEEYLCRESVAIRPPLPPLSFSTAASCGDDASFIVFGGLTKLPAKKKKKKGKSGQRQRGSGGAGDDEDTDGGHSDASDDEALELGADGREGHATRVPALLTRYPVFADAVVATYPLKAVKSAAEEEGDTYVNELGIEVSKDELPEHFKTFVRRQDDFLKKKAAAAAEAMHRTTMEEKEAMEPTLYLTEDEIERLIAKSEKCCTAFTESYKMDELPSNVPDREERIHITEECVSLSRQVRDVMKSMKASKVGVTAVKSKDHRRRAGQKFEDYSAAKPFRRIVVAHLLGSIHDQLQHMHRLNRGLHTVVWEEKQVFLDAIHWMQAAVDSLNKSIGGIVNKYISHRVEGLMKGVDKHKEVMRLLTEVVERNRRDKIFNKDQQVDKQRERVKRAWANAEAEETQQKGKKRRAGASPSGIVRSRTASAHHRRSLGAGYYKEESNASIAVSEVEWNALKETATKVQRCASALQTYCQEGTNSTTTNNTTAPAPQATETVEVPQAPPGALAGAAPPVVPSFAAPPLALPQTVAPPTLPQPPTLSGITLQTTLSPPATAPGTFPPPTLPGSTPPAPVLVPPVQASAPPASQPEAEAGALSNKAIVIRHSNELRGKIAETASAVGEAAKSFYQALSSNAGGDRKEANRAQEGASSGSGSSPTKPVATPAPMADGPLTLPPPTLALAPPGPVWPNANNTTYPPALAGGSATTTPTTTTGTTTTTTAGTTTETTTQSAPSASATTAAAPAKQNKDTTAIPNTAAEGGKHLLYLTTLRPLLEAREQLAKVASTAPRVRVNEWDSNNLAGAPQDVRVEKLCKRLQQLLSALVQHISGSFLSASGAAKPRKRIIQLSTVQPGQLPQAAGKPQRGPSAGRVARPTSTKPRATGKKSSSKTATGTSSSRHRSRVTGSSSSTRSSSASSSSSSSSSTSSSSSSGPTTTVRSAQQPTARRTRPLSAGTECGHALSTTTGRTTPSVMGAGRAQSGRAATSLQPLYNGPKSHLVQLATLNGDTEVGGRRESRLSGSHATSAGQRRVGGVGAELSTQAVALVPYSTDMVFPGRDATPTDTGVVPGSTAMPYSGFTASLDGLVGPSLQPSEGAVTTVVPNTPTPPFSGTAAVPFWGNNANGQNVFLDAAGTRPRFANDWAMAPTGGYGSEKRGSAVFYPTASPTPLTAGAPCAVADSAATAAVSLTRGTGPVMHAPAERSSQDTATAGSPTGGHPIRSRRSTISMLAQLQPEPVHTNALAANLEPATSISPGTFVVSSDYYTQTHSQPGAAPGQAMADSMPGRLPGGGAVPGQEARHWADVDEDYFYFGNTVHRGAPADVAAENASSVGGEAFADVTNRGGGAFKIKGRDTEQTAVTISPPIGTVLGSQRINAALVSASANRDRHGRRPSTGRCTASNAHTAEATHRRGHSSTARATTASSHGVLERHQQTAVAGGAAVNNSGSGPFRGRLTPGERQILEARERLRRH